MGWRISSFLLLTAAAAADYTLLPQPPPFVTDPAKLLQATEQKYLDMVPFDSLYNFSPSASNCLGVIRSVETKAALSRRSNG